MCILVSAWELLILFLVWWFFIGTFDYHTPLWARLCLWFNSCFSSILVLWNHHPASGFQAPRLRRSRARQRWKRSDCHWQPLVRDVGQQTPRFCWTILLLALALRSLVLERCTFPWCCDPCEKEKLKLHFWGRGFRFVCFQGCASIYD